MRSVSLIMFLFAIGCSSSSSSAPSSDTSPSPSSKSPATPTTPTTPTPAPPAHPKPDHKFTAAEWHAAYAKDGAATYSNKLIEITGMVSDVQFDPPTRQIALLLQHTENKVGLICQMVDANTWQKVGVGTGQVVIRGRCPDKPIVPGQLDGCELVSAELGAMANLKATEVSEQFSSNHKALEQKYDGKWGFVQGEIVEMKQDKDQWQVILKGNSKLNVTCTLPIDPKSMAEVQVGAMVKVLGIFELYNLQAGPQLTECLLGLAK